MVCSLGLCLVLRFGVGFLFVFFVSGGADVEECLPFKTRVCYDVGPMIQRGLSTSGPSPLTQTLKMIQELEPESLETRMALCGAISLSTFSTARGRTNSLIKKDKLS